MGVGIRRGYRDVGIGTEIMRTLTAHAKTMELEIIELAVASSNKRAIHVYEKVGIDRSEESRPGGTYSISSSSFLRASID